LQLGCNQITIPFWIFVWGSNERRGKRKKRRKKEGKKKKRQNADGVGDYDDAFSPVPDASGFWTILSLATQFDILTDTTLTSLKHSYEANYYQVTAIIVMCTYPRHVAMRKILSTCIDF